MDKTTQATLFASGRGDHRTPVSLFHQLNKEFNFVMDTAATAENTLCQDFLSEKRSAFNNIWAIQNWCNPPYGRGITSWINRAAEMQVDHDCGTVMLLPARTDTKWFHLGLQTINEVRFIKGRLQFQGEEHGAPFPSLLLVWHSAGHLACIAETDPHKWFTMEIR